jgi:hypothetical protein
VSARPGAKVFRRALAVMSGLGGLLGAGGAQVHAATITIENGDLAGQGFNDPTPVTPVEGNPGTTVGDQRMNVFKKAAQLWGDALESTPAIVVSASFAPLACGENQIMLGHATATSTRRNSLGSPPDLWVAVALANALAGTDLNGAEAEIHATFNGGLASCSMGLQDWYYGLDGAAGDNIDLLSVVLHELGHGLGFASVINPADGLAPSGFLDAFAQHVYDNGTDTAWSDMTAAERVTSAMNARHLVWTGENVARQAAQLLALGSPTMTATPALAGLAGNVSESDFGPLVSTKPVSGPLQLGTIAPASCKVTSNVMGAIALFTQSDVCAPVQLAFNAQKAGAVGILMMDPLGADPPDTTSVLPSLQNYGPVTIPVVTVSSNDAQVFAAASAGTTVSLSAVATQRLGADPMGRTELYASNPVQTASTLSHWDPLARPDLLMEPQIATKAPHDQRMELAVFRDIGWRTVCGNGSVDPGEECDLGPDNGVSGAACNADCTNGPAGAGGVTDTVGVGGSGDTGAGGGAAAQPEATTGGGGCQCDLPRSSGGRLPAVSMMAMVAAALAVRRGRRPGRRRKSSPPATPAP